MSDELTEYERGYVAGMRRAACIAAGWDTSKRAAGDIRFEANRYESIARSTWAREIGGQDAVADCAAKRTVADGQLSRRKSDDG